MLAQRLRRWPNIKTSLFQRVVFAGISPGYKQQPDKSQWNYTTFFIELVFCAIYLKRIKIDWTLPCRRNSLSCIILYNAGAARHIRIKVVSISQHKTPGRADRLLLYMNTGKPLPSGDVDSTLALHLVTYIGLPSELKTFYSICTTSAQRLRRWSNIVQILEKCFVFTGLYHLLTVYLSYH